MFRLSFAFMFRLFVHFVSAESRYLGDEVLVTRVVRGDDGEDVPVVFLHDVEYDRSLLLDGGAELKEHGVVILEKRHKHTRLRNGIGLNSFSVGSTHRGGQIPLKEQRRGFVTSA